MTNGIDCLIETSGVQTSILDHTIKTNSDITAIAFDARLDTYGNADDGLHARWSFADSGKCLRLSGATGDKLIVKVQDDLSGINRLHISALGYKG